MDPSDFFVSRNRSLYLLIANNVPSAADKLPSDAVGAMEFYSIGKDKDTKQPVIRDDTECQRSFLVNGSKALALIPTDNRIDNFSDSAFGQVLSGAFALISPLFSLYYGKTVPATLSGNISNSQATQGDSPPLKWSDLRYVFDIQEDCNGKEAIQA